MSDVTVFCQLVFLLFTAISYLLVCDDVAVVAGMQYCKHNALISVTDEFQLVSDLRSTCEMLHIT